ncbi:MAG: aminotransferase class I/II-fold pyridoxal phosphate-dependent enzyme, partial [Methanobacteriota archaeon]
QCMIWETSPAATELEERVMQWLARMIGLPREFSGVIQDTASTATLCAILSARERVSNFRINQTGVGEERLAIYCSTQTHSSIEKDVKIAGLGRDSLRKVDVDENFALIPEQLEAQIKADLQSGVKPTCVVATLGTTSSTAIDPLRPIGEICERYGIWLHVDAAFAGSALILPEKRWMIDGVEYVDSFVFNPHKWLFTNFDCSAYFVKDKAALIRTFEITPEYLKTSADSQVNNYRDWGIQLGRRFRALKLWFVLRSYGIEGLQQKLRHHLHLADQFARWVEAHPDYELLAPHPLSLICFRLNPSGSSLSETELDHLNAELLKRCNETGKMYITHTRLNDKYTLRMVIGQTYVEERHVEEAWKIIQAKGKELISAFVEKKI